MKINGAGHGLGDFIAIMLPKGHQEVGYGLMQAYLKGDFVRDVKATKTFLPVQLFRLLPVPALFKHHALCEGEGAVGRGHETREKGRRRPPGKMGFMSYNRSLLQCPGASFLTSFLPGFGILTLHPVALKVLGCIWASW